MESSKNNTNLVPKILLQQILHFDLSFVVFFLGSLKISLILVALVFQFKFKKNDAFFLLLSKIKWNIYFI